MKALVALSALGVGLFTWISVDRAIAIGPSKDPMPWRGDNPRLERQKTPASIVDRTLVGSAVSLLSIEAGAMEDAAGAFAPAGFADCNIDSPECQDPEHSDYPNCWCNADAGDLVTFDYRASWKGTPSCVSWSVCVWAEQLPAGAQFPQQPGICSASSTFSWRPSEPGDYVARLCVGEFRGITITCTTVAITVNPVVVYGACCNGTTGVCLDGVLPGDCEGDRLEWHKNLLCSEVACCGPTCDNGSCEPECDEDCASCPDDCGVCLIMAEPLCDESLWRTQKNFVLLIFDGPITAPLPGEVVIQELWAGGVTGVDFSSEFLFTVEGAGDVLRITENGDSQLTHRHWYRFANTGGWAGVADFELDYVVQVGDCDNNGFVLGADFSCVNAGIACFNCPDDRRDINGDHLILGADASLVGKVMLSFPVAKPTGHSCKP